MPEQPSPEQAVRICPACAAGWHDDCESASPVADLYPNCECNHD